MKQRTVVIKVEAKFRGSANENAKHIEALLKLLEKRAIAFKLGAK